MQNYGGNNNTTSSGAAGYTTSSNNTGNSGGTTSAVGNNSASGQPVYTAQQKADRAAVTTAPSNKSNIELMDKMGQSSRERRQKKYNPSSIMLLHDASFPDVKLGGVLRCWITGKLSANNSDTINW
ncbi:hypothetical protein VE02_05212 [Pseudogymnoascus sp. 03VT05]|nr:hypothetical protein VE02_05212 [Pseudogymnoascus sp. 03VT05]